MPYLNRAVIRAWLAEHDWTVDRLAQECTALGVDTFPIGTVRNAVNGLDPMREGRIRVICKVTARYGDGISYARLVAGDERASAS